MKQHTELFILGQISRKSIDELSSLFLFPLKAAYVTNQSHLIMQALQVTAIRGRDPTLCNWLADVCILGRPPNQCQYILPANGKAWDNDAHSQSKLAIKPLLWGSSPMRLLHQSQCNLSNNSLVKHIEPSPNGAGAVRYCQLWNGILPHRRRERMARDGIILIAGRLKVRLSGLVTHLLRGNKVLCENCFTKQKPNHVNPVLLWLRERYALMTHLL